jgi:alpha-tubulin suppressor-like RCC1 family protein
MAHIFRLGFTWMVIFCLFPGPFVAFSSSRPDSSHPQSAPIFAQISAGGNHTCALTDSGEVWCWGMNDDGQLGDGTNTNRSTPVAVVGLSSGVARLAAGINYTCAIIAAGGMKCWGANYYGQLGDGTTDKRNTPVTVLDLSGVVTALAASVSGGHTCALLTGGGLKCWGYNYWGQLGDGTTQTRLTPVSVTGLGSGVSAVSAGEGYTCALLTGGWMKCWGANASGQLGDGSLQDHWVPMNVIGLGSSVAIMSAGWAHTCAALSSGGVKCWGENWIGALGNGNNTDSSTPVDVVGLTGAVTLLDVGYSHTCVWATDGTVKCWGSNDLGELGDGSTLASNSPVDVIGLEGSFISLSAGAGHSCALNAARQARCWGNNGFGQVGDGAIVQRSTPLEVIGLTSAALKLAAGDYHTCVLTASGGVKCWGENQAGQLGDGTQRSSSRPVDVVGLASGVNAIAAGIGHTCALTALGGVKCWGANNAGQLGDGTTINRLTPVNVTGLASGVSAIAAGFGFTCALTTSGGVKCWGVNFRGQVGDGTTTNRYVPVDVVGLSSGVTAISSGYQTCALLMGGGVKCWGYDSITPADVPGLSAGVTAVSVGWGHSCVLTLTGAKCWGVTYNEYGEYGCGDGGCGFGSGPVDVVGLPADVTTIAAIGRHTCAFTVSGAMKCWGGNGVGELGDGTTTNRYAPVDVSGMGAGVTAMAGGHHTCAVVAGRVKCWGSDQVGQLGLGTEANRLTPTDVATSAGEYLRLSYPYGRPGSYFTVTGWNLPASSLITLSLNGTVLAPAIQVNPTGSFIFFLDTTGADPGFYSLRVQSLPHAVANFVLEDDNPLRPLEGGGLTLTIPSGLGKPVYYRYLPVTQKIMK